MSNLTETLRSLGPTRLGMMVAVLFGIVLFFVFLTMRLSNTDMSLLYSNLSVDDSGAIAAKLEQINIPYQISGDGQSVTVPSREVGRARMILAEEGLPDSASVGYEIFDNQSAFGTTDFVQNVNQVRALEGEISKTISTLRPVQQARLHLVLPKRELFSRENQPATASVFVKLRSGQNLSREQTLAIQHMVATAVPQLKPARVSIVDETGKLLARGIDESDDPASAFLNSGSQEMRLKYEQRLSQTIEDLVGEIVGTGNVRAYVSADLDFDRISLNEEIYDPEGQVVRSTQTIEESEEERDSDGPQGVTIQNNLPGLNQGAAGGEAPPSSAINRLEEVTNFEISKTIRNHVRESGEVKRLSVGVLVNGFYETIPVDGGEEGETEQVYNPRSAEQIEQIETLVRSAIGFDDNRGDTIEVINSKFAPREVETFADFVDDSQLFGFEKTDLLDIAETITLAIVALLVVLLVLQPLVNKLIESTAAVANTGPDEATQNLIASQMQQQASLAPPTGEPIGEEDEASMIDMDKVEGRVKASSVQKVGDLVDKHPQETVSVIRNWMYQEN